MKPLSESLFVSLLGCSALLCAAIGASGCGGRGGRDDAECVAGLLPGDLVITELMANPPSTDDGNEWWEIYNATSDPIDLAGVSLIFSDEDGTGEKSHVIEELSIEAGQYLVVGDNVNDPAILAAHVDYGYANDLGSLRNSTGRLAAACGATVIDEVLYMDPSDGASRGFDGSRSPDATGNDDLSAWCDATTEYADGALGTPGGPNGPCAGGPAPTTCEDNGQVRDIVAPEPGDLIITEFHPNPAAVADADGEWFEVYVNRTVDLNGLQLGTTVGEADTVLSDTACLVASEGSFLVFARQLDPATNGELPQADHQINFSLTNSNGTLFIGRDDQVLDEIGWAGSSDGAATNLDPDRFGVDDNDDPGNWCAAVDPYGAGDLGTPGSANVDCAIEPPDGMCMDGDTLRPVVAPAAGDIVITEFMANPEAVSDADGEWFEIRANAAFDLNGLELGTVPGEVKDTVAVEACLPVGSGDHAVFARSNDAATNGNLPVVHATFGFALTNSASGLFVGIEGTVLDETAWTSTSTGIATSLDGSFTDPADNDDEANWCEAVDPYGDGDLGTPGEENPVCGGSSDGMCLDGGNERPIVSPQVGDLVITEFMADPSAVADADGEWFEVLATADVDLNGLELGRDVGTVEDTLPSGGDCLAVTAGQRVVFARDADMMVNGGLADVLATFGFSLVNSDRGLVLSLDQGATVLDAITYTGTVPAGASTQLDPGFEDPAGNDDEANWCTSTTAYGAGDLGTPGMDNLTCG